ncbi:MAG TPA: hypothetical protein VLM85_27110 [Polyangiaceae bacterium]|nr:hypothetical protein [Polyangiaceae bacterium]
MPALLTSRFFHPGIALGPERPPMLAIFWRLWTPIDDARRVMVYRATTWRVLAGLALFSMLLSGVIALGVRPRWPLRMSASRG